ncbi:MarR family transcriptional regulator [Aurantiacibacter rhizosphaerae]|uniref:Winged helix DNA-binding protein n=1 Tax=Aurantiacibacter rhizosphaerae TaxID=2691582 RepID=A0A844XFQ7_9SPHN|nr:MarR family transcriptional regulator [Aurantiacibacter rhizosphaerae]MWV28424.1 winged helix DNA-binding protein [Aurantiacibacter rhizosphaerae]
MKSIFKMDNCKDMLTLTQQDILDHVGDAWSTGEMRGLGAALLRLADAIDQDWRPPSGGPAFRWPSKLSRIERDLYILGDKARQICESRKRRAKFIPASLFAEPAWEMLLELFQQHAGRARVSTTSLCIASGSPCTTALRYIAELEAVGLVRRVPAEHDKRVTFVELTDDGVLAVGSYLADV